MLRCVLRPPQLAASLFWSALQRRCPLLALSGHGLVHRTCPLSGVKRTTIGGELHLRLCRNDLLKISRPERSQKTRWGKHWGKQFAGPERVTPE